jgi:hypothetical protein
VPVATDKSISDFEGAMLMDRHFQDLKMTCTRNMSDDETRSFSVSAMTGWTAPA